MGLFGDGSPQRRGFGCGARVLLAAVIIIGSLVTYYSRSSKNTWTGETQHVALTVPQELQLGLQSAPEMAQEFGGESSDADARARVAAIGRRLVEHSTVAKANPGYEFQYHLLADPQTINAFALPGGQIFITEGLYRKLTTEGQIAGVLGHETGHVMGRHAAEHMAKDQLRQGVLMGAVVASSDSNHPNRNAAIAAFVSQMVGLRFSRNDEYEADKFGVRIAGEAGYDPHAMLDVMKVLEEASRGGHQPEFFSTHPNPENRIERIEQDIKEQFPQGLPSGLQR